MGAKVTSMIPLSLVLLLAFSVGHTQAACKNNEKRAENKAACVGQLYGGVVPYPGDCSKFLVCVPVCEYPTVKECPSGLWWDNTYKFCNLPILVDCDSQGGGGTITTTTTAKTTTQKTTSPMTTTTASSAATTTTKGRCNNERRPENKAACSGQRFGALVAYPGDCSKFLICVRICEYPAVEECPVGLWWDNTHKFCNLPLLVDCNENEGTTLPVEITTPTTTESSNISTTTKGRCNNERRPENKATCSGQRFGALVAYPGDCSKFLICVRICEYPAVEECPAGLWWDNTHKFCNLPLLVDCSENEGTTLPVEITTPPTTESSDISTTTKGRCNNERRPENKAACSGQRFGALVAYPGDCSKFLICVRICEYPAVEECPAGLWWDNTHKFCNLPLLVDCNENEGTTVPAEKTTTEKMPTPTTTESSDISTTTKGRCNNERRPENQAACKGQRFGALVAYPGDCSKFLICVRICEYPVVEECPVGLWWDNTHKFCNLPLLVDCDESQGTTVPIETTTTAVITTPSTTESSDISSTTKGRCNNERRPENQAACKGQRFGALVAYPGDCSKFLICVRICEYPVVEECPVGLWWDNTHKFCNLPLLVDCDESQGTTVPIETTTTVVITTPTTTTDSTSTTKALCDNENRPENQAACAGQAFGALVSYPGDCSKFLVCIHLCEYPTVRECPPGFWWDNTWKYCNLPQFMNCDENEATTTTAIVSTTESNKCWAPEGMSADICLQHNNGFLIRYPYNCNAYINCTMGCPVMQYCQPDKVFNVALKICDTPDIDECEDLPLPSTTKDATIVTANKERLGSISSAAIISNLKSFVSNTSVKKNNNHQHNQKSGFNH